MGTEEQDASRLPAGWVEALASRAASRRIGTRVLFFDTIGSTNDVALRLAEHGEGDGLVVVADEQTRGRGRRGHEWFSPSQTGLYASIVVTPGEAVTEPDRAMALVTLTAGVAIAEGIEAGTGLAPVIKWPNDLLVGSRKVAGILAESSEVRLKPDATYASEFVGSGLSRTFASRVVLGYGINVGSMAYPPELATRATSLEQELGRPVDRASLFAATLASLDARYADLMAGRFDAILDAWRARAAGHHGARVGWTHPDGERIGITAGIDGWGALLVSTERGIERIVAGELRWECFSR